MIPRANIREKHYWSIHHAKEMERELGLEESPSVWEGLHPDEEMKTHLGIYVFGYFLVAILAISGIISVMILVFGGSS